MVRRKKLSALHSPRKRGRFTPSTGIARWAACRATWRGDAETADPGDELPSVVGLVGARVMHRRSVATPRARASPTFRPAQRVTSLTSAATARPWRFLLNVVACETGSSRFSAWHQRKRGCRGVTPHEEPLAADAVEDLQEQRAEQVLPEAPTSPRAGIEPVEVWRELAEDPVDHHPERQQGTVWRDPFLWGEGAAHAGLLQVVAPSGEPL